MARMGFVILGFVVLIGIAFSVGAYAAINKFARKKSMSKKGIFLSASLGFFVTPIILYATTKSFVSKINSRSSCVYTKWKNESNELFITLQLNGYYHNGQMVFQEICRRNDGISEESYWCNSTNQKLSLNPNSKVATFDSLKCKFVEKL